MENINSVLEIYKLHCDLTDKMSQRRIQINQYFIGIISAIITATASAFLFEFNDGDTITSLTLFLITSIIGITFCYIWIINIESYRQINSAKFETLQELEKKLPFSFFEKEWIHLGKGKDRSKYRELSKVEKYMPKLLMFPFVILLVYSLMKIAFLLFKIVVIII